MADASQLAVFGRLISLGSFSANNHTLDANTDGHGFTFQAIDAEPITHLGFRYGARTGTPPTYSIRLETPDSSGLPDNADVGGGSATAATFTPPADATWNGTWQWVALTNPYTPTRGQVLCGTIRYSSGTIDGSNNSSITNASLTFASNISYGLPTPLTLTAGTWAKVLTAVGCPIYGVRTASSRYGFIAINSFYTTISTAGNRQAMHWTPPAGLGDTLKVVGARMVITTPAAGQTLKIGLWDSAGTALQDASFDSDLLQSNGVARNVELFFDESSLATLSFGTKYYLGVEVVSTNAVSLRAMTLGSADDRLAWPGGTTRGWGTWNGSSWTDDDTMVASVEPILADWTEPAGGGGGSVLINAGMSGGLRG